MTLRDLVLVRLGVAVNLVMGQIVAALLLPVFLDAVGTILVASLVGPVPAIIAGITTNVVAAVISGNFTWLPFGVIQVVIAVYAAGAARVGAFRSWRRALPAGTLLGLIAGGTAAPISLLLFGGVTAGGVTLVTAALRVLGVPLEYAVYVTSIGIDMVDKTLAFGLVFLVLRNLPRHLAARFPALVR